MRHEAFIYVSVGETYCCPIGFLKKLGVEVPAGVSKRDALSLIDTAQAAQFVAPKDEEVVKLFGLDEGFLG